MLYLLLQMVKIRLTFTLPLLEELGYCRYDPHSSKILDQYLSPIHLAVYCKYVEDVIEASLSSVIISKMGIDVFRQVFEHDSLSLLDLLFLDSSYLTDHWVSIIRH